MKNISVFENSSIFLMIWNIIHIFLILFFFFIIPLEKSFDVKLEANYEQVYYLEGAFYFFLLDIAVILNTSVYIKGKLIRKRKTILQNYLQTSFSDIIRTLLDFRQNLHEFRFNFCLSSLELMFFLRMLTFSKIIAHLEEMFFIDQSMHNILFLVEIHFSYNTSFSYFFLSMVLYGVFEFI